MLDLSQARAPSATGFRPDAAGGVTITAAPAATRFSLRGAAAVSLAGPAFGVDLPTVPCRAASNSERVAFWLGPDEWLLLAPEADGDALQQTLDAALAEVPHALVDISHRQTALSVEGTSATTVLNAGVPLDLAIEQFPVGTVVRTIFDKAEIVLWRSGETSFRIEVWRSFAPYVLTLLEEARDDEAALEAHAGQ
jgi:sarcosine oxidase subunit gamma